MEAPWTDASESPYLNKEIQTENSFGFDFYPHEIDEWIFDFILEKLPTYTLSTLQRIGTIYTNIFMNLI